MVYGRVYSIRSHQTTDIYIGSTTQTLSQRMTDHRKNYKQYLDKKKNYITSYEIIQYEDAYIELLFEGEFESKNALERKEGNYIREMNCVNKIIAGRTPKEWREDNKDHVAEHMTQYREENKTQIAEHTKNIMKNTKNKYQNINSNITKNIKNK